VLLETYRECLRRFLRHAGADRHAGRRPQPEMRIATVDSERPSPFAASLLFTYVASFIYDGDAPLAERRAQALSVDQSQLRELLGDAELRELLDAESIETRSSASCSGSNPQYHRQERGRRARHAAVARRSDARRDCERSISADVAASVDHCAAPGARCAIRIAGDPAFHRRRGRGALSRRARACHCRSVFPSRCCSRARSARRPRAALRAHARAVYRREFARRYGLRRAAAEAVCCG
jgi:ATP-dependent Lhr-like helicase